MKNIKDFLDTLLDGLAFLAFVVIFGSCFAFLADDPQCRQAHRDEDVAMIMTYCR